MENQFITIIVELRPRVRSGNIFLKMKKDINSKDFQIKLKSNGFELSNELNIIYINCPGNYSFVEESLSSLTFGVNYIYFHFNLHTSNKSLGSIKTELVEPPSLPIFRKSNIMLSPGISYEIQCINCQQTLNESINFKRILPLPSCQIDLSEWFCHKHGGSEDKSYSFSPKITELFFNSCYFHLNENDLKNVSIKSKFIVCKRCLFWLGFKVENYFKSWFHNIQFISSDKVECSSARKDIFLTISEIVNQTFLGSTKILFESQCSPNRTDYLFLWILDKNLKILFANDGIDLKEQSVYKILYNFENDMEVVKLWVNDGNISSVIVSKLMMNDVLKELNSYHKLLPESFSKSNGLKISYLLIPEE